MSHTSNDEVSRAKIDLILRGELARAREEFYEACADLREHIEKSAGHTFPDPEELARLKGPLSEPLETYRSLLEGKKTAQERVGALEEERRELAWEHYLDRARGELEETQEELHREYHEKDLGYAFGLFKLLDMWQNTGRASIKLTEEQVDLIYDALAFEISLHLPLPWKLPREPYDLILGGDSVLRLMTEEEYDHSMRIERLKRVVERLSVMMLMEERIRDCQTWPCLFELDGYSLSAVSVALGIQELEHARGWPLLELNRATQKMVDDAITGI